MKNLKLPGVVRNAAVAFASLLLFASYSLAQSTDWTEASDPLEVTTEPGGELRATYTPGNKVVIGQAPILVMERRSKVLAKTQPVLATNSRVTSPVTNYRQVTASNTPATQVRVQQTSSPQAGRQFALKNQKKNQNLSISKERGFPLRNLVPKQS